MRDPLNEILYPNLGPEPTDEHLPFSLTEGRIISIDIEGITFVLDDWPGGELFKHGPAPYAAWAVTGVGVSTVTGPSVGNRCLVAFLGTGAENPWVIGWWPS